MKEIKIESLTYGNHIVYIDDEDFEIVSKYKWHLGKGKKTFYAESTFMVEGKTKCIRLHKLLYPFDIVDHKDRNGLNNCRNNLRVCTYSQNNANRTVNKENKHSKFKGVVKHKSKWRATIQHNKKQKHLGIFDKEEDAAKAYNKAALEIYGEYARINEI